MWAPGAIVKATGNIKAKQAFGEATIIKSDKNISNGLVTDDVSLRANHTYRLVVALRLQLSVARSMLLLIIGVHGISASVGSMFDAMQY